MQEFLKDIFLAVITAAVPVLTAYIVVFIRKLSENAAANTESVTAKMYITEAAEAIRAAVAATNQTYVDALKNFREIRPGRTAGSGAKSAGGLSGVHQPGSTVLYRGCVWRHSGIPDNPD